MDLTGKRVITPLGWAGTVTGGRNPDGAVYVVLEGDVGSGYFQPQELTPVEDKTLPALETK